MEADDYVRYPITELAFVQPGSKLGRTEVTICTLNFFVIGQVRIRFVDRNYRVAPSLLHGLVGGLIYFKISLTSVQEPRNPK